MELRIALEKEWKRRGVRFANHLVQWSDKPPGERSALTGLFYRKGKCLDFKPRKRVK